MKKFIMFLFFAVVMFGIGGCSQSAEKELAKISKNLNSYTMDIKYNENHTMDISQTIKYKNFTDISLDKLCMHLYPKAFSVGAVNTPVGSLYKKKAYPNGVNYGDIVINSLKLNETETEICYDGGDKNILRITLENPLSPDDEVMITIQYKVTIPNCLHRFGYGDDTINVANFYPIMAVYEDAWVLDPYNSNGDPFYSDLANYYITLNAPSKYVLATGGKVLNEQQNDGNKTYLIEAKGVRDYCFVLSEKFQMITDRVDDIEIKYYYYNDSESVASLQAAVDSIYTFSSLFGKYPYNTFSVVQTDFIHGGMEYPTLVYISDSVTQASDYRNVIIHETAHQWWYGLVGSNAYRHAWLDEGLTDYSTALFYKYNSQYKVSFDEIIENTTTNYITFVDLYTRVLGTLDTSMNRCLNQYNTEPEYVYLTYVKGVLFFDCLSDTVGEEKFLKTLKNYYKKYKYTNVNPNHLRGEFEKTTRSDLKGFFDSWLSGKVVIKNVR